MTSSVSRRRRWCRPRIHGERMVTPDMNAVVNALRAPVYRMSLSALLRGYAHPTRDVEIRDLTQDSRAVTPGAAFVACQGRRSHGLAHAAEAVERGAVAVL